jgi:acyl-CoA reductase-like NAD-dependent aldehyde dehydrogenase
MSATASSIDLSFLAELGIGATNSGAYAGEWLACNGPMLEVHSPATGELIAKVQQADAADYEKVASAAHAAYLRWRELPAPVRGEYVRRIGDEMRKHKDALGKIVTWEMGKILQEGLGEVQEAIDIADFAVGQSRMLYGLSLHSERPQHSMKEQWHPIGVVGIISAFNFPSAVWAWNSMLAMICGNASLWKPSWKTPLTAIAMTNVARTVVGTAGQRCTSTRRVLVQKSVREKLVKRLLELYSKVSIGNPLGDSLMGPLIDQDAVDQTKKAIARVQELGGKLLCGGEQVHPEGCEGGFYMTPAIATAENHWDIVQHETFGPILYVIEIDDLDHAIQLHNDVPQGLSSAIFSMNVRHTEKFLSAIGSDCGIANVNIGTSGAEIGGAFGGEKETGGGRESGSDAWKAYMRRQTNTINYGSELPLAQGVKFDVD